MGSRTHLSQSRRSVVYHMFNGHCAYCGQELPLWAMEVDHFKPYCSSRCNDLENLFPSCSICNAVKSIYSIEEFREIICQKIKFNKGKIIEKEFYTNQNNPIKFYYETINTKEGQYGQK